MTIMIKVVQAKEAFFIYGDVSLLSWRENIRFIFERNPGKIGFLLQRTEWSFEVGSRRAETESIVYG